MGFEMPTVPAGTGKFPITLVAISANEIAASGAFYAKVFGWQLQPMSSELTGVLMPAGPTGALRAGIPAGFPGIVPYIAVSDVEAMLGRVVAAGGMVEKASWKVPMAGTFARFKDPSGTIYGLTDSMVPVAMPRIEMPFGANPKPPAGSICSLEMYALDGPAAAQFVGDLFGWASLATMPQFMAFDPGAGVGGVFQSHTPAVTALAYIYVDNVEASLLAIAGAGGKVMGEAMRMPGMGCFGYFSDPSGTAMGLIGP